MQLAPHVVVGVLPQVHPGETLVLTGEWVTGQKWGKQFKATSVEQTLPATVEGIRDYLGSDLIHGIGPGLAADIVDHFGADTLRIMDHEIHRLKEVPNIGPKRLEKISASWVEHKEIKNVMIFLKGFGVTTGLAIKIFKAHGARSVEVLQQNPYVLTRITGVGFKLADQVAMKMGVPLDSPQRIQAGLVYALEQGAKDGHVYLTSGQTKEQATKLLGVRVEQIEAQMETLAQDDRVVLDEARIYLKSYFDAEAKVAERVKAIVGYKHGVCDKFNQIKDWPKFLAQFTEPGIEPTETQLRAVQSALTSKVTIITGGPGTGKTTITNLLCNALTHFNFSINLMSPTGRAAKRLSEATGRGATTIHRGLGFHPGKGWQCNEEDPLTEDVLIVDEASMLDCKLAYRLMVAVKDRMHVVFVGDVDQLPSVGAGDVLRDLIKSDVVSVVRLDVIFRQSEDSFIITNSHEINEGRMPVCNTGADFFFFDEEDPEKGADLIVDIVQNRIPQKFGVEPDDVQVLAPMHKGSIGVQVLNEKLQAALNPNPWGRVPEKKIGWRTFREGDKVMVTKNNYDKWTFNGDVGRLLEINERDRMLVLGIDGRLIEYKFGEAGELVHAFAMTCHKSQGSEYKAVVMVASTAHYIMLQRNLLYTAVTRAKELVVIVGAKRAIAIAVKNDDVRHRNSWLAERLGERACVAE
jgi:exodeoxyribonuclease V alpha subunit